ncbi:similar to Saccharomyces cerevisiae YPR175W DPB2 Second largest subunit of DNA polymerase II (DNA polymerase epsilon), required for normal yeast chromosomal replication [Maudiozyma barnettii]|uniref:DNA polymerase epsilon subunit B n=1 Tax=Maudiozyma barnettii TaxID=61262 RepID=A0A8H2VE67_9SACH|nr:DNA polymerase epsilon noncatalytic subunit [Kazachstania barnettii]CAB4253917.1 similar to Saccharomyces cerevisiae YPR175W DPB2 Second largest subunit of DNA polymerase II (DNA polymerase epsilon), required for normal yeast chromosomal replication [Kazachstania barnettii]CAD1781667.1 similar to Saccharomyces cerevisiae YPR175W DPB2 Second largest subunit of DNA polymerase II (DNA polymerase epsilon), required for normal yeast chromosomal replication [Kazachstania barnettii]
MFHTSQSLPVQIQPAHLRPLAYRTLSKKYGLSIKSDGLAALAQFIGQNFGIDWKKNPETIKFLENFATVWKQQERGLFVDGQGVQQVINEIQERQKILSRNINTITRNREFENSNNNNKNNLDKYLNSNNKNNNEQELSKKKSPEVPINSSGSNSSDIEQNHIYQSPEPIDTLPNENENDEDMESSMIANTSMVIPDLSQDNITDLDDIPMGDADPSYPLLNNNQTSLSNLEGSKEELNWRDYFKFINATELQKFSYDPLKMHFIFTPSNRTNSPQNFKLKLPTVNANTRMFSTRYYLVRDRIMRNEAFQSTDAYNPLSSMMSLKKELTPGFRPSSSTGSSMSITPVKNLLGRDGQNFLILGLLRKNSKGNWTIEDPSGITEIDISQAIPTEGLYYVPGCIVLAEGIYFTVGNKFHVTSMTQPPGERRETTMESIGNIDLLGINGLSNPNYISRLSRDLKIRLHYLEQDLAYHRYIILGGDIFLNQMETMDALRKVFTKINDDPPTMILLYGSFSTVPVYSSMTSKMISSTTQYKNNFDTLALLLSEFKNLIEETTFVFIPGVNDPWSSTSSLGSANLFPQRPIPTDFQQKMNRVCKNVVWGSNPLRIAYMSQEIITIRDDLDDRFKRHSVIFPMVEEQKEENVDELERQLEDVSINDSTIIHQLIKDTHQLPTEIEQSRKYVKTLLDQGNLSPFLTTIRPVVWDLDHSLTMYPIPSILIVCDTSAPRFDVTYNGCKTLNPGKFLLKRCARYLEYTPSLKRATQEEVYF